MSSLETPVVTRIRRGYLSEPTKVAQLATMAVDVSIVLPVFNEQGHLVEEIERIRKAMDGSDYGYELQVVASDEVVSPVSR